ncbi:hypothetical protein GCM10027036_09300 [Flavihumibacter cheonanensis]
MAGVSVKSHWAMAGVKNEILSKKEKRMASQFLLNDWKGLNWSMMLKVKMVNK